jgi:hypothetical protein
MNCSLPKITYPTFRQLLLAKIHKAVDLWMDCKVAKQTNCTEDKRVFIETTRLLNAKDSLKRVKKSTSVVGYQSPIALKLAASWQRNITKTVLEITEIFQALPLCSPEKEIEFASQLFRDLTVKPTEVGLLELEFGDRAIASWLQAMVDRREISPDRSLRKHSAFDLKALDRRTLFLCQQSYARCGSLLRMAEAGKLLSPTEIQALPWLTPLEKLRFPQASDLALIREIVTVVDELGDERGLTPLKLVVSLSQQFQHFHRDCRIFGEIAAKDRSLAQARLGLVMITHSLLRVILEECLEVCAPDNL